jgi:hypothetical protein
LAGFIYIMARNAVDEGLLIGQSYSDPTHDVLNALNIDEPSDPYCCKYYAFVENIDDLFESFSLKLNEFRNIKSPNHFFIPPYQAIDYLRELSAADNLIKFEEIFEEITDNKNGDEERPPPPSPDGSVHDEKSKPKSEKELNKDLNKRSEDFFTERQRQTLVRERKKLILILCALVCGATLMGYFTNGISGALSLGLSAAVVSAFVIYSFNKGQS